MADVVLPMPTADSAPLPPVCVGCGRPAKRTRRVRILGSSSGIARMFGEYALDNLEQMARSPGSIRLPVCWWHRWIWPPTVEAAAGPGGTVVLAKVSAEFAAAVRDHQGPRHASDK
jgi:hypothetical protein